jgi:hypothetical protein
VQIGSRCFCPDQTFFLNRPFVYPLYGYGYGYHSEYDLYEEELGRRWAHDLKEGKATLDQLVAFIREELLNGSARERNSFRHGFVPAYGKNGSSIFEDAMKRGRETVRSDPARKVPAQTQE